MLKLWGGGRSLNVQKVLWCCLELGIDVEQINLGGQFGGTDNAVYLALNPNGKVPTIQDGDAIIWESNTILRYLCATRGGEGLHPVDPVLRTRVERWMDWQLAAINPPMSKMLWAYYRVAKEKLDGEALETARLQSIHCWSIVDQNLAKDVYLAGPNFTLADIGLGILAYRWFNYPIDRPDFPNLRRWYERLSIRPGFVTHVAVPIS